MKAVIASLVKNAILIGILALWAYNYFYNWLNWQELLAVAGLSGLLYIFVSCYEYLNASYKASLPGKRYAYFNSSYLMVKILKIATFFAFAALLFTSSSQVRYLYPVCLIIASTETIITLLKYWNDLCFVTIYANYLLISQDRFIKLFASEIVLIEFRHDILYFVKKDTKAFQIKLEHIDERENFLSAINDWINRNNVNISAESKIKIKESTTLH